MTKTILWVVLFLTGITMNAQLDKEKKAIKNTIDTFFEALHKGDSTLMKTTLHKKIKIQTTRDSKEGKNILLTESRTKLLTNIANKNPKDTYFEKLLSYDIKVDGNLASVWTPYEFYYNGNFSHCGANSFQLYDDNGTWKIIYLVDMRRRQNCTALTSKK